MKKRTYKITGMDCVNEVEALKRAVGRVPGVAGMNFNVVNGTMSVTASDGKLNGVSILTAVKEAGMEAVSVDDACLPGVCDIELSYWQKKGRTILCLTSGVFVLVGFISHILIHGSLVHALVGGETDTAHLFPLISILFYAVAVVTGGWFILPKAIMAVRRLRADMNLLMTIAVIGAMAIGQWLEAATVTFLFAFSLLLESWSIGRARRAIRNLLDITPPMARYLCPVDGDVMEKPLAEVPLNVIVLVRPGERIPLDGVVTKGDTHVNQAPITGESMPVRKKPGDDVFAGTINDAGFIEFRATRAVSDTTLARIIHMVEEAQSRRAPSEQWVEKFARYYTPFMVVLALGVATVPPLFAGGGWYNWFYEALVLLVIACPCALVISTPVSIVAALTSAARAGVLIKGGAFLEAAARVKVFALDKTGTLTRGIPEIQEIVPLNGHSRNDLLARAAALEIHSEHPLATAVLKKAEAENVKPLKAQDFKVLKGRGAEATIEGRSFWVGSHRLLHEKGVEESEIHEHAQRMEDAGHSVIVVGSDQHVCGLISVADSVRPEAIHLVRQLKAAGVLHIAILTGDNRGTADAVGLKVGADEVRAELLPEDKMQAIQDIERSHGPVAMVGDGINDAPALASASIGIAMGAVGSDAAVETADIALMSDDLVRLPWLVCHARRSLRIIRQNVIFALSVKTAFMTLALLQLATLWMAIAADMGASLLVILNALRLLHEKKTLIEEREIKS